MDLRLSDEQRLLRDVTRQFLEEHAPPSPPSGTVIPEPALWKRLTSELGIPALRVPVEDGGHGCSLLELCLVFEELGRALCPVPALSTVALGVTLLLRAPDSPEQQQLLAAVLSGDQTLAAAIHEDAAGGRPSPYPTTWRQGDERFSVTGSRRQVVDGAQADILLVPAVQDGVDDPRLTLFAVPSGAGVHADEDSPGLDLTRQQATIRFVDAPATLIGGLGSADEPLARSLDEARTCLAAELLGAAEQCLDMTVEHVKARQQFGRAVGSFQAVQHRCADMLVRTEQARAAVYHAAAQGAAGSSDVPLAAALALSYAAEASFENARDAIQLLGGVGFTWEHVAHLYYRRAKAARFLLGSPRTLREALLGHMGRGWPAQHEHSSQTVGSRS